MKKWKWQLLLTISCKNRSMRSCGGSTTDVFRWMTKQVLRVRSRYAVSFCTHTHTTHRVISLSLNDSYTSSESQWVRLRLPHPLKVVQYICGVTRSEVWRGDADDRHVVGDLHLLLYTGQVVRLVLSKHLVWPVIVLHGAMIEPLMWDRNVKMFFFFLISSLWHKLEIKTLTDLFAVMFFSHLVDVITWQTGLYLHVNICLCTDASSKARDPVVISHSQWTLCLPSVSVKHYRRGNLQ